MIDRNRQTTGFTVGELIVAMTISAITLLSGYELLVSLKTAGNRQSEDLATTAGIIHGLDRIRQDLQHAVIGTRSREPIFVGGNPALNDQTQAFQLLCFYSLCAGCGEGWARGLRQMCQVSYDMVWTEDSVYLYRCVVPVVGTGPASGRELILDGIEQIRIAFYTGQQWENSFSSKYKLPVGVELMMTVSGREWPLSVKLPCGNSGGQP